MRRFMGVLPECAAWPLKVRAWRSTPKGTPSHANMIRFEDRTGAEEVHVHAQRNLQTTVDGKVAELERASRLKRYLSPGLAESILSGERDVSLGTSRKLLTTFFSDVRGFTAAAERMEPDQLVDELNDYLTEMTEIVFRHGGTLDKYVGDAVMVFFGDPLPQDDHAKRAVLMGFEMRERMAELQDRWLGLYQHSFKIGIGLCPASMNS